MLGVSSMGWTIIPHVGIQDPFGNTLSEDRQTTCLTTGNVWWLETLL